jgi:exosortase
MVSALKSPRFVTALWGLMLVVFLLPYAEFARALWDTWLHNEEFSFGVLLPVVAGFLIWSRREQLKEKEDPWPAGLALVILGSGLLALGTMSGTLLFSGIALSLTAIGMVGFLWGPRHVQVVWAPLSLLVLMVPLPSYVVGEFSWMLQSGASTISSRILGALGVPVYQDGNLLRLPNYVLEVKQACSGSRSIFALLALAVVIGLSVKQKWWIRIAMVAMAPVLAVFANVVRIVGTGVVARKWGQLAANESLHAAWGILVFLIAVMGLLGVQRLLQWATSEYA